jgi:hypothetical protein
MVVDQIDDAEIGGYGGRGNLMVVKFRHGLILESSEDSNSKPNEETLGFVLNRRHCKISGG